MYAPQFAYPAAPGKCDDQRFSYSYDATNLPAFTGTLAAGQQTGRIPLSLDKDADFYLRAINIQGAASVRLEDPDNNPLSDSDNRLQAANFMLPAEYGDSSGAGVVALDAGAGGVYGPAGGNFMLLVANLGSTPIELSTCAITLHGVKRYTEKGCA